MTNALSEGMQYPHQFNAAQRRFDGDGGAAPRRKQHGSSAAVTLPNVISPLPTTANSPYVPSVSEAGCEYDHWLGNGFSPVHVQQHQQQHQQQQLWQQQFMELQMHLGSAAALPYSNLPLFDPRYYLPPCFLGCYPPPTHLLQPPFHPLTTAVAAESMPTAAIVAAADPLLLLQDEHCGMSAAEKYGPGPPIVTGDRVKGPRGCNLFVFHLPNEITNWDLYLLFRKYGAILSVHTMINKETGRSRGYGFISYSCREEAQAAIDNLDGFRLGKKRLKVQFKRAQDDGNYDNSNIESDAALAAEDDPLADTSDSAASVAARELLLQRCSEPTLAAYSSGEFDPYSCAVDSSSGNTTQASTPASRNRNHSHNGNNGSSSGNDSQCIHAGSERMMNKKHGDIAQDAALNSSGDSNSEETFSIRSASAVAAAVHNHRANMHTHTAPTATEAATVDAAQCQLRQLHFDLDHTADPDKAVQLQYSTPGDSVTCGSELSAPAIKAPDSRQQHSRTALHRRLHSSTSAFTSASRSKR